VSNDNVCFCGKLQLSHFSKEYFGDSRNGMLRLILIYVIQQVFFNDCPECEGIIAKGMSAVPAGL
jgi:hypothetical protein